MTDTPSKKMTRNEVLRVELAQLRQEHVDLKAAIEALHETVNPNAITLQRLKRKKLALKDEMARLEDEITPDIIA